MDYSICKALSYNMKEIEVVLVMYNIMCQYQVNFQWRVTNSLELSIPSSLELQTGIGLFHIHGHPDSCLPHFSSSLHSRSQAQCCAGCVTVLKVADSRCQQLFTTQHDCNFTGCQGTHHIILCNTVKFFCSGLQRKFVNTFSQ